MNKNDVYLPEIDGSRQQQLGFTLVEMLVVITIIGILASISISTFISSQIKARDTRRKNDLEQISKALEAYYNDKGEYPAESVDNKIVGCEDVGSGPTTCEWGAEWVDENGTVYMIELPADNTTGRNYYYGDNTNGAAYQLYARLENTRDSQIPTLNGAAANYGVTCGTANCNYGLSSPNTTPEEGRTITAE